MKTLFYLCVLTLALELTGLAPARAQRMDWQWTTSLGWPGQYGPGQDLGGGPVKATADGGALVAIGFVGSVNFGTRRDTLRSSGKSDAALIKYSAAGTKLWTVRIGGLEDDGIGGVDTDAQGNIYVVGSHQGTVYFFTPAGDFLPGSGVFLVKYTAAGVLVQVVSIGQSRVTYTSISPVKLHVTPSGSCVVVGYFSGAVTMGSFPLTPVVLHHDAFVARVSAAGVVTGVNQFNSSAGGVGPELRSSALLPNGDVIIQGSYRSYVSFPPSTTLTGQGSFFAVCYTAAGTVRWARDLPLNTGVAAGPAGQAYAVGGFGGVLALDTLRATSRGGQDVFVARLDALTGAAQGLAYAGGGPGDQVPLSGGLAFSAAGLPTLMLRNDGAAQFGPVSVAAIPSFRQFAALQFGAGWQPQRAFTTESQLYPLLEPQLALDPQNQPFVLANAPSQQVFGPLWVQPQGTREVVLAHAGLVLATHPGSAATAGVQLYPNPARTAATVVVPAGLLVVAGTLFDALGRACWSGPLPGGRAEVPVAGLAPGAYVLRLRTAAGATLSARLLVQP